jgi:outer membrane protein OmpA-like peptidoglycan-associated protein
MRVNFGLGSAELTNQARVEAREFSVALQSPRLSGVLFTVGGHTDAIGNRDYNLARIIHRRGDSGLAELA